MALLLQEDGNITWRNSLVLFLIDLVAFEFLLNDFQT